MTGAGELREKLTFAERQTTDDGYGGVIGNFSDQFTVRAKVQPLKGGEGVVQARLAGRQPVVITVYYSSETAQIQADWRATDARTGVVYAITAPPANMDRRKRFLDILAVIGEAA